jgi:hypothetical protein
MLAFVDASTRFLSISVVCASSAHDSTLFGCSKLGQKIMTGGLGDKWTIVGDDAFMSCCGNIITPFAKHTLNARQRNFNYFCSLLRQVVECALETEMGNSVAATSCRCGEHQERCGMHVSFAQLLH